MPQITTFLTFNDQAEAAATFYVSLFPNSRIVSASPMMVEFELDGQRYLAMNGGPHFTFSDGISLCITCETSAEVDELWTRLTADGGREGQCGWLKDRFGVSWQVVPAGLGRLLGSPDREKAQRVMAALRQMGKIDLPTLEQA